MGGIPNRLRRTGVAEMKEESPSDIQRGYAGMGMFRDPFAETAQLTGNLSILRDLYSVLTTQLQQGYDEGLTKLVAKVRDTIEQNVEALEKNTEKNFGVPSPAKMRTGPAPTKRKPGRPPKKPVHVDGEANTAQPEPSYSDDVSPTPQPEQNAAQDNAQVAPMPSSPPPTPPSLQS